MKNDEEMTPKSKKKYFLSNPFGTSDKIILLKNYFYMFLGKKNRIFFGFQIFFLPWEKNYIFQKNINLT